MRNVPEQPLTRLINKNGSFLPLYELRNLRIRLRYACLRHELHYLFHCHHWNGLTCGDIGPAIAGFQNNCRIFYLIKIEEVIPVAEFLHPFRAFPRRCPFYNVIALFRFPGPGIPTINNIVITSFLYPSPSFFFSGEREDTYSLTDKMSLVRRKIRKNSCLIMLFLRWNFQKRWLFSSLTSQSTKRGLRITFNCN
jgi:hypothetical protein